MNKAQTHPLAWCELQVPVVPIIGLVALLRLLETLPHLHEEPIPVMQLTLNHQSYMIF
jgi:hypothetical protein